MCGIVGILGRQAVATPLVEALKRLEYRGYDSAGLALINGDTSLHRIRTLGKVAALEPIAKDLECTLSQLAIAWCLKNPYVSTVITGASRVEQVHENMKASEVATKLTPDLLKKIDTIFGLPEEEDED